MESSTYVVHNTTKFSTQYKYYYPAGYLGTVLLLVGTAGTAVNSEGAAVLKILRSSTAVLVHSCILNSKLRILNIHRSITSMYGNYILRGVDLSVRRY